MIAFKKTNDKILLFLILILFVLNAITLNSIIIYNLFLFFLCILLYFRYGWKKSKILYRKDVFITIVIFLLSYFLITYLSGLYFGFRKTIYHLSFSFIGEFLLYVVLYYGLREIARYMLLSNKDLDRKKIIFYVILFVIFDFLVFFRSSYFNGLDSILAFFGQIVLPSIFTNILCTYITLKSNFKINIFYLIVMNGYIYFVPFIPNYSDYLYAIIRIIFPVIIFYVLFRQFNKHSQIVLKRKQRKILNGSFIVLSFILLITICLTSGYFRYVAIAVGSDSMMPSISKGDVVIVDKKFSVTEIDEDDILAFFQGGKVVVHRVVEKISDDGYISFRTKGDYNNDVDEYIVLEDEVYGVVNFKIKYIGLPTVLLKEYFNK